MYWAFWRRQGPAQSQVRLHLSLDLAQAAPARAVITPGKVCERAAWRTQCHRGDGYLGDRYYGEDYRLLGRIGCRRGWRLWCACAMQAVINVLEELPLTAAERASQGDAVGLGDAGV